MISWLNSAGCHLQNVQLAGELSQHCSFSRLQQLQLSGEFPHNPYLEVQEMKIHKYVWALMAKTERISGPACFCIVFPPFVSHCFFVFDVRFGRPCTGSALPASPKRTPPWQRGSPHPRPASDPPVLAADSAKNVLTTHVSKGGSTYPLFIPVGFHFQPTL